MFSKKKKAPPSGKGAISLSMSLDGIDPKPSNSQAPSSTEMSTYAPPRPESKTTSLDSSTSTNPSAETPEARRIRELEEQLSALRAQESARNPANTVRSTNAVENFAPQPEPKQTVLSNVKYDRPKPNAPQPYITSSTLTSPTSAGVSSNVSRPTSTSSSSAATLASSSSSSNTTRASASARPRDPAAAALAATRAYYSTFSAHDNDDGVGLGEEEVAYVSEGVHDSVRADIRDGVRGGVRNDSGMEGMKDERILNRPNMAKRTAATTNAAASTSSSSRDKTYTANARTQNDDEPAFDSDEDAIFPRSPPRTQNTLMDTASSSQIKKSDGKDVSAEVSTTATTASKNRNQAKKTDKIGKKMKIPKKGSISLGMEIDQDSKIASSVSTGTFTPNDSNIHNDHAPAFTTTTSPSPSPTSPKDATLSSSRSSRTTTDTTSTPSAKTSTDLGTASIAGMSGVGVGSAGSVAKTGDGTGAQFQIVSNWDKKRPSSPTETSNGYSINTGTGTGPVTGVDVRVSAGLDVWGYIEPELLKDINITTPALQNFQFGRNKFVKKGRRTDDVDGKGASTVFTLHQTALGEDEEEWMREEVKKIGLAVAMGKKIAGMGFARAWNGDGVGVHAGMGMGSSSTWSARAQTSSHVENHDSPSMNGNYGKSAMKEPRKKKKGFFCCARDVSDEEIERDMNVRAPTGKGNGVRGGALEEDVEVEVAVVVITEEDEVRQERGRGARGEERQMGISVSEDEEHVDAVSNPNTNKGMSTGALTALEAAGVVPSTLKLVPMGMGLGEEDDEDEQEAEGARVRTHSTASSTATSAGKDAGTGKSGRGRGAATATDKGDVVNGSTYTYVEGAGNVSVAGGGDSVWSGLAQLMERRAAEEERARREEEERKMKGESDDAVRPTAITATAVPASAFSTSIDACPYASTSACAQAVAATADATVGKLATTTLAAAAMRGEVGTSVHADCVDGADLEEGVRLYAAMTIQGDYLNDAHTHARAETQPLSPTHKAKAQPHTQAPPQANMRIHDDKPQQEIHAPMSEHAVMMAELLGTGTGNGTGMGVDADVSEALGGGSGGSVGTGTGPGTGQSGDFVWEDDEERVAFGGGVPWHLYDKPVLNAGMYSDDDNSDNYDGQDDSSDDYHTNDNKMGYKRDGNRVSSPGTGTGSQRTTTLNTTSTSHTYTPTDTPAATPTITRTTTATSVHSRHSHSSVSTLGSNAPTRTLHTIALAARSPSQLSNGSAYSYNGTGTTGAGTGMAISASAGTGKGHGRDDDDDSSYSFDNDEVNFYNTVTTDMNSVGLPDDNDANNIDHLLQRTPSYTDNMSGSSSLDEELQARAVLETHTFLETMLGGADIAVTRGELSRSGTDIDMDSGRGSGSKRVKYEMVDGVAVRVANGDSNIRDGRGAGRRGSGAKEHKHREGRNDGSAVEGGVRASNSDRVNIKSENSKTVITKPYSTRVQTSTPTQVHSRSHTHVHPHAPIQTQVHARSYAQTPVEVADDEYSYSEYDEEVSVVRPNTGMGIISTGGHDAMQQWMRNTPGDSASKKDRFAHEAYTRTSLSTGKTGMSSGNSTSHNTSGSSFSPADPDDIWNTDADARAEQAYLHDHSDMIALIQSLPVCAEEVGQEEGDILRRALVGSVWRWDGNKLLMLKGNGAAVVVGFNGVEWRVRGRTLQLVWGIRGVFDLLLVGNGRLAGVRRSDRQPIEAEMLGRVGVGESFPHGWLDRMNHEKGGECVMM